MHRSLLSFLMRHWLDLSLEVINDKKTIAINPHMRPYLGIVAFIIIAIIFVVIFFLCCAGRNNAYKSTESYVCHRRKTSHKTIITIDNSHTDGRDSRVTVVNIVNV